MNVAPIYFFCSRVYFFVFLYSLSSDLVDRFPPLETLKGGKDKSAWQRVVSSPLFSCCLCRLIPRRRDSAELKLSHHVETKVVSRNAKLFVYYLIAVDVGCTAAHHFAAGCRVAVLTFDVVVHARHFSPSPCSILFACSLSLSTYTTSP